MTPAKDAPEDDKPAEDAEHPVESEDTDADNAQELPASASLFITRFREVVEARLENSELSVEDLAADMNLSRVQLYRKVKAVTGATPVEILRTARLNRGYQLLLTTDKSVSEVAYQVGFTAPSYFTKCFKEEYGKLPGDVRQS
jgi:AraC-like DNA-binding protein